MLIVMRSLVWGLSMSGLVLLTVDLSNLRSARRNGEGQQKGLSPNACPRQLPLHRCPCRS